MNLRNLDPNYRSYILNTGEIAGGANKVMLDLFNSQASLADVYVFSITASAKSDVAVTGVVSARFDINRTSAIGTGGTGHSYKGSAPAVLTISPYNTDVPDLSPYISARQAPTGGATPADWLTGVYVFPEETNAATILAQESNIVPGIPDAPPIVLHQSQGLVITQGSVASVNSFVFTIVFGVVSIQHA